MDKTTTIKFDQDDIDANPVLWGEYPPGSNLVDPGTYALIELVPCGTCGGDGIDIDCDGGVDEHTCPPCPAGCWDGWVPKDGTREWRCEYQRPQDACLAFADAGVASHREKCGWVWVLPERTET